MRIDSGFHAIIITTGAHRDRNRTRPTRAHHAAPVPSRTGLRQGDAFLWGPAGGMGTHEQGHSSSLPLQDDRASRRARASRPARKARRACRAILRKSGRPHRRGMINSGPIPSINDISSYLPTFTCGRSLRAGRHWRVGLCRRGGRGRFFCPTPRRRPLPRLRQGARFRPRYVFALPVCSLFCRHCIALRERHFPTCRTLDLGCHRGTWTTIPVLPATNSPELRPENFGAMLIPVLRDVIR